MIPSVPTYYTITIMANSVISSRAFEPSIRNGSRHRIKPVAVVSLVPVQFDAMGNLQLFPLELIGDPQLLEDPGFAIWTPRMTLITRESYQTIDEQRSFFQPTIYYP